MATVESVRTGGRSEGPSVQDVLRREAEVQAVPGVLLSESVADLGSDDLPRERYFSREFHDLEVAKMWRKVWQMACREDDIASVGDTLVYDIADDSIVLVRVSETEIKGYYNTCLHRGTALCEGEAHKTALKCPFHGWTWNLDGTLKTLPCSWDFPHLSAEELRLPEVKVDTWDGWVFLNMDLAAEPLADYLEVLPEHFAAFPMKDRYKAAHVASRVPCNWKLLLEAFIESYHATFTHPQLAYVFADANTQYDVYGKNVSRMITLTALPSPHLGQFDDQQAIAESFISEVLGADPGGTSVPDGQTARRFVADAMRHQQSQLYGVDFSGLSDSEAMDVIEYSLFPNMVPWGGYGLPIVYRYRPDGNNPESCIVDMMLLIPLPPGVERPPPAPVHWIEGPDWREAAELGPLGGVFNQDMANVERQQKGMKTGRKPGVSLGLYQEVRIRHHAQTLTSYLEG